MTGTDPDRFWNTFMVETVHLLPPEGGLQSDPMLFGIAQGLVELFPIDDETSPVALRLTGAVNEAAAGEFEPS